MSDDWESSRTARLTARAWREASGWLLIGIGVFAAVATGSAVLGGTLAAIIGVVFSLLLVLTGAVVAPSVRRRLDHAHSPTAFGRTPVVERRVVYPEQNCRERCVVCDARVDRGLVRRYREDITVAGIPLVFGSNSHNHYCLDCARAEMGLDGESPVVTGESDADEERELAVESS